MFFYFFPVIEPMSVQYLCKFPFYFLEGKPSCVTWSIYLKTPLNLYKITVKIKQGALFTFFYNIAEWQWELQHSIKWSLNQTNGPWQSYWPLVFVSIHNHSSSMNSLLTTGERAEHWCVICSATRTHVATACLQSLCKHRASIPDIDYCKAHTRWCTVNVYTCACVCVFLNMHACEKVKEKWWETVRCKERRR